VCVNKPKNGSEVISCTLDHFSKVCLFVDPQSQQNLDSVASAGDTDMILGRRVDGTKVHGEFKDGCSMTTVSISK